MVLALCLRVSWLCLLLFSSAACFPATKGDYRYPYTASWGSGGSGGSGGSAPGSGLQSGATGPLQAAGYVSPPVGSGKGTPGFSEPLQPVGGNLNVGSVYEAPPLPPSAFAYPAEHAGNSARAWDLDTPVYYTNTATGGFVDGPVSYGDPSGGGSLGWVEQPAGGASFYEPGSWMPSRSFPDFSAWDSSGGTQQRVSETSPLPPSSYIIQSRNAYQRARELLSHTKYSPEYPEAPVLAFRAVKAPSKAPPATFPESVKI